MNIWTILVDQTNEQGDYLFEDRLFFAALNRDIALEQLQQVVLNPAPVVAYQFELDYDDFNFYHPEHYEDDVLVHMTLINHTDNGNAYTYLHFRLVLLDLRENSTAQTSIPDEIISQSRDLVCECIGKGE